MSAVQWSAQPLRIKRDDLDAHLGELSKAILKACGYAPRGRVVELTNDGAFVQLAPAGVLNRQDYETVTNDLGKTEEVIGVRSGKARRRLWFGLHERWVPRKHHREFRECALRVFEGDCLVAPSIHQIARLEWVAPNLVDGSPVFTGGKAAHPHWHIDESALARDNMELQGLADTANASNDASSDPASAAVFTPNERVVLESQPRDYTWMRHVHFAAHGAWMHAIWDAGASMGPHQSSPQELRQLTCWWQGALQYVASEFTKWAV